MRKFTKWIALTCIGISAGMQAQEQTISPSMQAAALYGENYSKFRLGGYGEMAASYMDYGPNRILPNGSSHENRGTISIPRFVLALDYKFTPTWILGAEIEWE